MNEFVCPDGTMSVNGVCRMFMTPNQREDLKVKDKIKPTSSSFSFDFENIGDTKETADNMISKNIDAYQNFVEDKLGISPQTQTLGTFASMAYGLSQGGGALAVLGPVAVPFIGGAIINQNENRRIQNITDRDPQGTITTYNMQNRGSPNPYGGGPTGIQSGMATQTQKQAGPGFKGTGSALEMGSF